MKFIDESVMDGLSATAFQATRPYPWLNPRGFLRDEGYARLVESLPAPDIFDQRFGERRKHGQQSHDRLALEYRPDLPIAPAWHEFVAELKSERYMAFIRRMFGRGALHLLFHWHYTPNGCSVSPHCDARRKLGSHIFYLNTERDWRPDWGGETLILDDNGRFSPDSAPRFEDFDRVMPSTAIGNYSLLFMRRDRSWHGVKEIHCPPDALRKVFIVVIEDWSLPSRLLRRLKGRKRDAY
jgi:hypothetical protein